MIEKGKNSSNYCKYCGWEFQYDVVQKINENTEPIYCEFCGVEIDISSINYREEFNKEKFERISNFKENIEKKKKSIFKSTSKLTKSRKHSVDVIFEDDDFPKIFKENLIIVISRLIYISIREWEQDNNVSVRRVSLTKSILYELADKIKYMIDKRPGRKFLQNLCKLTIEEFEDWLRLLQKKIDSIQEYRTHFKTYLLWLVKIVFKLVSEMWEMKNLPKLQSTILKDLKAYNFDFSATNQRTRRDSKINILEELETLSLKYENPELLFNISKRILEDAYSSPKKLTLNDLRSGYRSNPKYLASVLIYYGLRHEDYNSQYPKYRLYGVLDYINNNYPNNATMKSAITNIVPRIYDFISDSLKFEILYYPRKGHEVSKEIRDKVKKIKEKEASVKFLRSIRASIKKYSKILPFSEKINKIAIQILDDALEPPIIFSYDEIIAKNIWFTSPKAFAICFLFLAYNHKDYGVSKPLKMSEFSKKYFRESKNSLQSNVSFIYLYISRELEDKIAYLPTQTKKNELEQQIIFKIPQSRESEEREIWRILKNLFKFFNVKDQENYLNIAKDIYISAKQNGFDSENIVKPNYLAITLLYFTLLREGHRDINKKKILITLKDTKYSIWDKGLYKITNEFGNYININQAIIKYDIQTLKENLLKIKERYKHVNRYDNLALIKLLLKTLNLCKSDSKDFINKLAFIITKKKKPSALIEKLLIPNNFDKISKLDDFVKNYRKFIRKLIIDQNEKMELYNLLKYFEQSKKEFYKFEEKRLEKIEREKERYQKYGEYFYSHKIRVKRFLLMLGFSPFDGFDLWRNKIYTKGKYRIYANFHHYRYNPEEQSGSDLVFIPIKPPKKIRVGEYLTKKYLTHNTISGLEGNLKRNDISNETRTRILEKLQKIEDIIEYNSSLLEKAVYTQNYKFLYDLKNWLIADINRVIDRLKDEKFSWAKRIEKYLPTAEGYEHERINAKETESIIKKIKNRKR